MQSLNLPKVDNVDVEPAAEYNSFANELQNLITVTGQTLNGANLNQIGIAAAIYAAGGEFYVDTGAANAYVVTPVNSKRAPHAYFDGMRVRFLAANSNTTASTINVNSLGVKNIRLDVAATALPGGYILQNRWVELFYNDAGGYFVLANQYPLISDLQYSRPIYCVDSGAANALVASVSPAITAYGSGGLTVLCKVLNTNTGSSTINLNGLGVKSIVDSGGLALVAGDLISDMVAILIYDGTNFQLQNRATGLNSARAASVYLNANFSQTVQPEKVPFDTVEFDTNSFWNASDKRFVLNKPGKYRISYNLDILITNEAFVSAVYLNGTLYRRIAGAGSGVGTPQLIASGSIIVSTNTTTDYVEVYVEVCGASTIKGTPTHSYFQLEYIGS